MWLNKSKIESTYKSADTEELLDRLFYRKVGYGMAITAKAMGLSPNTVTFISVIIGIIAGHLFFYQNTTINLFGVLMLITAEAMDGADGQLARLTNTYSRYGRIFDGVAGNLWFISIYLHMSARFIVEGGTPYIFLIAVISGVSHSFQSAMADFYRIFYLFFIEGKGKDIDNLSEVKQTYSNLDWLKTPFKKFLLRVYINYLYQQHWLAKSVRKLYSYVEENYDGVTPSWLKVKYRILNKPMIKYQNILTTNTRMIVLFVALFWGNIFYYFLFELIVLNILLAYFVIKEEKVHKYLFDFAKNKIGLTNA